MARITIEDCVSKVKNRFELVIIAAQRAREIIAGALPLVKNNNEKEEVLALREISENLVNIDNIKKAILKRHQKHQVFAEDDRLDEYDNELINDLNALQNDEGKSSIITNMYAVESYDEDFVSESNIQTKKVKSSKLKGEASDDEDLYEDEDLGSDEDLLIDDDLDSEEKNS